MKQNTYRRRRGRSRKKLDIRRFAGVLKTVFVITLTIMALYLFSQSPFFALQEIEGKGLQRISLSELTEESGLSKGQNLFRVDTDRVKRRLLKDPLIERAEVKRRLPRTIVIEIKERQPRALFLANDAFLVIDRKGYCLDKISSMRSYNLPIITGIKASTTELGKKVSSSRDMISILAALDPDVQNFFSEFNIAGKEQLIAYSREGIPVLLGSSDNLSQKLHVAVSFMKSLNSAMPVEYVDIRAVNAPAVKYQQIGGTNGEKLYNTDKT
ncbi:MAG TPA: FtsQ-type POTRA domain-containing protein [Syntrophomonadaceae bacterium]|nr:FtsQ-type POTRA domain-containing protein [Syntrophomonadaceae bacterium]